MIGGRDINVETPAERGAEALEFLARTVRDRWPQAVYVDGATGQTLGSLNEVAFAGLNELLLFRDETSRESWERLGAVEANVGTAVYALVGESRVTVVVYDEGENSVGIFLANALLQLSEHAVLWPFRLAS